MAGPLITGGNFSLSGSNTVIGTLPPQGTFSGTGLNNATINVPTSWAETTLLFGTSTNQANLFVSQIRTLLQVRLKHWIFMAVRRHCLVLMAKLVYFVTSKHCKFGFSRVEI